MKKVSLFLTVIIFITSVHAQNAYYDALEINRNGNPEYQKTTEKVNIKISEENFDRINSILYQYLADDEKKEVDDLIKKVDNLKVELSKIDEKHENFDGKQKNIETELKKIIKIYKDKIGNPFIGIAGTVQSQSITSDIKSRAVDLVSSIGGINVATFANELSKFMIDRAKQELNVAFFNRLKAFFEKNPEVTVLFPKTTDALENLLSYQYPTMISTLRNAFHEDLQEVFFRTDDVFKLPKYRELVKEFPEIILSLKTIQLIAEIDNEAHPSDILGDFKDIPEWKEYEDNLSDALYNFYNAFKAGHMFSESVRFDASRDDFVLKHDIKANEYYIQRDSGIALATKESSTYFKIDTIRRDSINELVNAVAKIVRENFDKGKLSNKGYTNAFFKNLFGDNYITQLEVSPPLKDNIEELIEFITSVLKTNPDKFEKTKSAFLVKRMIRDYESSRAWVTRQHLNYLIQDTITFRIYLGLLYQQSSVEEIQFVTKFKLESDRDFTNEYLLRKGSIIKKGSTINLNPPNSFQMDSKLPNHTKVTKGKLLKESHIIEYKPLTKILEDNKDTLFMIRDYLVEVIEQAEEVDDHYNSIKKKRKEGQEITQQEIYEYVNTGINVIETTIDVSKFFSDEELDYDNYLKIARNGNDMYLHIVQKEYSSAVSNLVSIFDLIMAETKDKAGKKKELGIAKAQREKSVAITSEDKTEARQELKKAKRKEFFDDIVSSTTKILKYGTFMANLVQSDSAEEISAAIQSAALPVGSYSIKRASRYNVSLNAYLGASYSGGIFDEVPDKIETNPIGIWAPVGIAGSIGLGKSDKGGSVSIFLSIIDVGAFVNYNLTKSSIDTLAITDTSDPNDGGSRIIGYEPEEFPDIKLEDIFSPGIHLIYGIPRWPLSIGIGRQRRPELNQIEVIETILDANGVVVQEPTFVQTIQANTWSWQVTLTIDLPLINLYSRPK